MQMSQSGVNMGPYRSHIAVSITALVHIGQSSVAETAYYIQPTVVNWFNQLVQSTRIATTVAYRLFFPLLVYIATSSSDVVLVSICFEHGLDGLDYITGNNNRSFLNLMPGIYRSNTIALTQETTNKLLPHFNDFINKESV